MTSEQRFWLCVVSIITAGIVLAIVGGMCAYNQRLKFAFDAGYEEGVLDGQPGTSWVKPKH